MVRPSDQRKRMYEAKVDPEILATQTRVLKALMVREETRYFPVITTIEEKVKRLVEAEGTSTLQVRDYLNFGREMYELTKKFSGSTLAGEAQLRVNKWSGRGLTGSLLVRIAQLFGVTPTVVPTPTPPFPLIPEYKIGQVYGTFTCFYPFVKIWDLWANWVDLVAYPVTRKIRVDLFHAHISGIPVGGEEMMFFMYDSTGGAHPNHPIWCSPVWNLFTQGMEPTFPLNLILNKGLYFIGWSANQQTETTRLGMYVSDVILGVLGSGYDPMLTANAIDVEHPFGTLPDPFPEEGLTYAGAYRMGLRVAEVLE